MAIEINVKLGGSMGEKYKALRLHWSEVLGTNRDAVTAEQMVRILIESEYRRRFPDRSVSEGAANDGDPGPAPVIKVVPVGDP